MCSTIVPLTLASPFFRTVDWAARGVELVQPDAPLAQPLDPGPGGRPRAVRGGHRGGLRRRATARAWRSLFGPLARDAGKLVARSSLRPVVHLPRHPLALARFGLPALRSAAGLARSRFRGDGPRALFAGLAAHSMLPLDAPLSASFGLVLGTYAHAVGWPMVRGGSAAIADALAAEVRSLGGEVAVGHGVRTLADVPPSRVVIADTTPQRLRRSPATACRSAPGHAYAGFRYGPGVVKVDWALDGPDPVVRARPRPGRHGPSRRPARRARGVRGGGRRRSGERAAVHAARPVPAVGPSRAPAGRTTAWAYCHVPNGMDVDASAAIESPGRAVRARLS